MGRDLFVCCLCAVVQSIEYILHTELSLWQRVREDVIRDKCWFLRIYRRTPRKNTTCGDPQVCMYKVCNFAQSSLKKVSQDTV